MLEKHSLLAVPLTVPVEQDVLYYTIQACPLASGQAQTYEVSVLRKVLRTLRTFFTKSVLFFLT
jgi:hypothetical protein